MIYNAKMKKFILALLFLTLPAQALEKDYAIPWCSANGGVSEYVLDDKTRVDCLTNDYAIEFDYAYKWAEAIGQSLYYAKKTGRKPAIVLLMKKPTDERYAKRIKTATKGEIMVYRLKI